MQKPAPKIKLDINEMINHTPSCLKVISKDGELLSMNARGLSLIESPDFQSVYLANVYDIVHPQHRDEFIKFNHKICSGISDSLIFRIVGLEGTIRWMQTFASPYTLPNGEMAHIAITNDITESYEREIIDNAIEDIRKKYIDHKDSYQAFFDFLLEKVILLTESEYGFIGEILEDNGSNYLKSYAISDISWNEETKKFYDEGVEKGLIFNNLETLFGEVVKTGMPILTNSPSQHPKSAGIPHGHPRLDKFMGIPLYHNNKFIAMVGLANREAGYDENFLEKINPVLNVIAQVIGFFQLEQENDYKTKELSEANKYIELAIEGTGLGIWDWYLTDNSVKFDKRWAEMIGLDINEIEMHLQTWESRVHPDDLKNCYNDIKSYMDGKTDRYQNIHRMRHADGHWVYILDQGKFSQWDENGNPIRFTGTHLDITSQKEQEKELILARNNAIHAERVMSEFLANMSHEIRTPMNGLLGMIELLSETKLAVDQKMMLDDAKECGEGLMSLLNDILDFSKIEAGKIEIEESPFELKENIDSLISIMSYQSFKKELEIVSRINEKRFYIGDIARIRQILMNFISNAIKFTEKGKISIDVNITESTPEKDLVEIKVTDTGMGISQRDQQKLFEDYIQVNSEIAKKFGGTGLGLSICKKLAKIMKGDIILESEVGKGSTFILQLMLKKTENIQPSESNLKEILNQDFATTYPHRILVVEDNLVNQKLLERMLQKLGYECEIANNGKEAIEKISKNVKTNPFDVILMDMRMPEMDGIEATKIIRKDFGHLKVNIIAVTANAYKEDKEACLNAGMSDFVSKPISMNDIKRILQR